MVIKNLFRAKNFIHFLIVFFLPCTNPFPCAFYTFFFSLLSSSRATHNQKHQLHSSLHAAITFLFYSSSNRQHHRHHQISLLWLLLLLCICCCCAIPAAACCGKNPQAHESRIITQIDIVPTSTVYQLPIFLFIFLASKLIIR